MLFIIIQIILIGSTIYDLISSHELNPLFILIFIYIILIPLIILIIYLKKFLIFKLSVRRKIRYLFDRIIKFLGKL